MKRERSRFISALNSLTLGAALAASGSITSAEAAKLSRSPEEEARELAKVLKPIPDSEWKSIAGGRIAERYEIIKGDTLFDISKRLFGDGKYWPKIWALNNDSITNPHHIRPGKAIAFMPGTGTSLPSVAISTQEPSVIEPRSSQGGDIDEESEPGAEVPRKKKSTKRSEEWKLLPHQKWEEFEVRLPPEVDPQGFDRRSRIQFRTSSDYELDAIPATETIEPLGEIQGSLAESSELMLDQVYIRSENGLQLGEVYAITQRPNILSAGELGRRGYSYPYLGRVEITGVRDQVFVGKIINARSPIPRGALLMPVPPRIKLIDPIPGPSPLDASLIFDHRFSTYAGAQHKQVFVDRGSDDGVQPGMVFRAFEYRDPATAKRLTDSDMIVKGSIMIVQVTPKFSAGVITNSSVVLEERSRLVLLTDLAELKNKTSLPTTTEQGKLPEVDELERLEQGGGLGKEEEKELQQLERFKNRPAAPEPTPSPSASAAPEAEIPPPPATPETAPTPEPSPSESAAPQPQAEVPPPPPSPETSTPSEPAPAVTPEAPAPKTPVETAPPPPPPPSSGGSSEDFPPPPAGP